MSRGIKTQITHYRESTDIFWSGVFKTITTFLRLSFIGEESVSAGKQSILTNNPTWIIDPIDGTTNFIHR